MSDRLTGKVALITGAGSGMGRAISLRLVDEGARVLAVDVDAERLAETREMAPGEIVARQADLGDPDACVNVVDACVAELGRLDILGNVAGIYLAEHATKITREQYRRVMAVNLDAYFFLSQAAIPHLLDTGGNIVNIASNAGIQGVPYSLAYSMSKGGVIQLTRSLAVEVPEDDPAGQCDRSSRYQHQHRGFSDVPSRHGPRSRHSHGRASGDR
jgi:NAD(P)-dependent dehydrogenase (short-subunit alcohol dehydrogenase family)